MNLLERIISLYAPHTCVGCSREGVLLCQTCTKSLPLSAAVCYRCKAISAYGKTCSVCRPATNLVSINHVATYSGAAKNLLWGLKFDRAQAAADIVGRLMAERFGSRVPADVCIVPVPTATSRVRKRGYDQAALIARSFARQTGCRYTPLLIRHCAQEQIGASRQQRRDQLRGVYSLESGVVEDVKGSRILLIDDVVTTGATLEEAAITLKSGGARTIGALVFARA